MDAETFATWMGGLESFVVMLALIVGAVWSFFLYKRLNERDRARAELEGQQLENLKLQHEIESIKKAQVQSEEELRKIELEIKRLLRESSIGPVIEISILATQKALPNDSSYYVEATVEIENKGKLNTRLVFEDRKPFFVYAVDIEDTKLKFQDRKDYHVPLSSIPSGASPSMNVRVGGSEKIPFFFKVDSPGLYLLVFSVPLSKKEQERAEELGFKFPGRWAAKKYFIVEPTPPNGA